MPRDAADAAGVRPGSEGASASRTRTGQRPGDLLAVATAARDELARALSVEGLPTADHEASDRG